MFGAVKKIRTCDLFRQPLRRAAAIVLAVCASAPFVFAQQRAIVNPSLELPIVSGIQRIDESNVPGWFTTHPVFNICDTGTCRPIEMWSSGTQSVFTSEDAGAQFAELNAELPSMIYQNICLTQGESFTWSFLHRQRVLGNVTDADVAQFRIGIPGGLPSGSKAPDDYEFVIAEARTGSGFGFSPTPGVTVTQVDGDWVQFSGTYTYTGATRLANIGFAAVSTGNGDVSVGNFLDNWVISLEPYAELSAAAAQVNEGTVAGGSNAPANRPAVRIGGTVPDGSNVVVTLTVTGGTATVGTDYSLTNAFAVGSTTTTTSVTIPAGVYDGTSASSIFPFNFAVNPDSANESNETVEYQLSIRNGAALASVSACGATPVSSGALTIVNDDFAPTAAGASISGRVMSGMRGVPRARVSVVDSHGNVRTTQTSLFGYFSMENLRAGESVTIQVSAKGFRFAPQTVALNDNLTGFNIYSLE